MDLTATARAKGAVMSITHETLVRTRPGFLFEIDKVERVDRHGDDAAELRISARITEPIAVDLVDEWWSLHSDGLASPYTELDRLEIIFRWDDNPAAGVKRCWWIRTAAPFCRPVEPSSLPRD